MDSGNEGVRWKKSFDGILWLRSGYLGVEVKKIPGIELWLLIDDVGEMADL